LKKSCSFFDKIRIEINPDPQPCTKVIIWYAGSAALILTSGCPNQNWLLNELGPFLFLACLSTEVADQPCAHRPNLMIPPPPAAAMCAVVLCLPEQYACMCALHPAYPIDYFILYELVNPMD
jgi:hypothetical protein